MPQPLNASHSQSHLDSVYNNVNKQDTTNLPNGTLKVSNYVEDIHGTIPSVTAYHDEFTNEDLIDFRKYASSLPRPNTISNQTQNISIGEHNTYINKNTGGNPQYKSETCDKSFSVHKQDTTNLPNETLKVNNYVAGIHGTIPSATAYHDEFTDEDMIEFSKYANSLPIPLNTSSDQTQHSSTGEHNPYPSKNTGGNPQYKSETCDKPFSTNHNLKTHIRTHTVLKPYTCETCGKSLSTNYNLKTHMRTHTGLKPYQCETCGKSLASNQNLENHIKTHTGEQSYKCHNCGRLFSDIRNLKRHIRTHTGNKPYTCETCGNSFSTNQILEQHIRTHTGDKPYKCNLCGRGFTQLASVKRHIKTIHKST